MLVKKKTYFVLDERELLYEIECLKVSRRLNVTDPSVAAGVVVAAAAAVAIDVAETDEGKMIFLPC